MTPPSQAHPARPTVYDSAIDLWIALMLFLGPAFAAALGIYCLLDARRDEAEILLIAAAATLAVTLALTIPCRYTLDHDCLSIRCGILFFRIPLSEITEVERSRTLASGPALSMRRVVVTTTKRKHVLSPRKREEFIEDLRGEIAARGAN